MPDPKNIKKFYKDYLNSPNYKKRLTKQGYKNVDQVIKDRQNNLNSTSVINVLGIGNKYIPKNKAVNIDDEELKKYGNTTESTLTHEYSHVIGSMLANMPGIKNTNLALNKNEVSFINSKNKYRNIDTNAMPIEEQGVIDHDSTPFEAKADIDTLRYYLKKDNIYDTGTQEFNQEILNKAKSKYKDNKNINRSFKGFSDKDLIDIMNNVAVNDKQDTLMAKKGINISKKAQSGLILKKDQNPFYGNDPMFDPADMQRLPYNPELAPWAGPAPTAKINPSWKGSRPDQKDKKRTDPTPYILGSLALIDAALPKGDTNPDYVRPEDLPTYNPLPYGTGSQAIMKKGGKIKDNEGYRKSNVKNFTSKKIIDSNLIDTTDMSVPAILANGKKLYNNTGTHFIPGDQVEEIPLLQKGGKVQPIITNNPNDKRLKAYNDSLTLYNANEKDFHTLNSGISGNDWEKLVDSFYNPDGTVNPSLPREAAYQNLKKLNNKNPEPVQRISKKFTENYSGTVYRYKKPIQPIQYKKPASIVKDKTDEFIAEYNKIHPPIYISDPKDPRLNMYTEAGNQYLYKAPKPKAEHTLLRTKYKPELANVNPQQVGLPNLPQLDLTQKPTQFTVDNNGKPQYFNTYDQWKSYVDSNSIPFKQEAGDKSSAQANYFQDGGNMFTTAPYTQGQLRGIGGFPGWEDYPLTDYKKKAPKGMSQVEYQQVMNKLDFLKNNTPDSNVYHLDDSHYSINPVAANPDYVNKGGNIKSYNSGGVQTHSGGNAPQVSYNPIDGGMGEFQGKSHSDGGIQSSFQGKAFEAEGGEPYRIDGQGDLEIFGNLTNPLTGSKFKKDAKMIAKKEKKTQTYIDLGAELVNTAEPTKDKFELLKFNSGTAMLKGGLSKQKELVQSKEQLSKLQKLMLSQETNYAEDGGLIKAQKGATVSGNKYQSIIDKYASQYGVNPQTIAKIINLESGFNPTQVSKAGAKGIMQFMTPTAKSYGLTEAQLTSTNPADIEANIAAGVKHFSSLLKQNGGDEKLAVAAYNMGQGNVNDFKRSSGKKNYTGEDLIQRLDWKNQNQPSKKGNLAQNQTREYLKNIFGDTPNPEQFRQQYYSPTDIPQKDYWTPENPYKSAPQAAPANPVTPQPYDFNFKNPPNPTREPINTNPWEQLLPAVPALIDRTDSVQMQKLNPDLYSPYSVDFQDRRNRNTSQFQGVKKAIAYDPSAQGALSAQMYEANSGIDAEEFRTNQAIFNDTLNKNVTLLNNTKEKNLQLADTQYVRQATAKGNTRDRRTEALVQVSDILAKNALEDKTLNTYRNLFPNYNFDENQQLQYIGDNPLIYGNSGAIGSPSKTVVTETEGKPKQTKTTYDSIGRARFKKFKDGGDLSQSKLTRLMYQ